MNIDDFLNEKLSEQLKSEQYIIDVNDTIEKAQKIKRKREKIKIAFSLVSCLVIFISISLALTLNFINRENMVYKAEKTNEEIEEGIIEIELGSELASLHKDVTYDMLDTDNGYNIVIARVTDTSGFNYTEYNARGNGNYYADYCDVRTRANLVILESIKGSFNAGDNISAYSNGGIIEYEKYIEKIKKYPNSNKSVQELESEYNTLLSQNVEKVYVKECNKDNILLERGKTYLLTFTHLEYGDNYINSNNYWLREYDENTKRVLNNTTGKWEELKDIIGGDYNE